MLILSAWSDSFSTAGKLKSFVFYIQILLTNPGILLKDRLPDETVETGTTDGTVTSSEKQILDVFLESVTISSMCFSRDLQVTFSPLFLIAVMIPMKISL